MSGKDLVNLRERFTMLRQDLLNKEIKQIFHYNLGTISIEVGNYLTTQLNKKSI